MRALPSRTSYLSLSSPLLLWASLLWALLLTPNGAASLDEASRPAGARPASGDAEVRAVGFNRDVRPLLADRCFRCHGPDEGDRRGRLRLDRADGPGGAYQARGDRPAIVPGSAEESELWRRITSSDPDRVMPPPGSHKAPLDPDQAELLRRWIDEGAAYEVHWAFVPPTDAASPEVIDETWIQQPLDRLVLKSLEARGMKPSPRADRRTLVRRVTLDLTGLPPTPDEVHDFLGDSAPGAYERLVDRLLASPHYGEHMSRYWLDLVRFADTNGIHHDHYRELSPYRDWVIRAFNAGMPYEQFVIDQLAGDLHPTPTDDQQIASGFNRLHMIIDVGTALPEESFSRNVIDRVTAVGTAFFGLTFQCAVCHDHKYDPITQKDFYRLSAFFNNLDAAPETGSGDLDKRRGLQPPYLELPSADQRKALDDLDRALSAAIEDAARLKATAEAATDTNTDTAAREGLEASFKEAEGRVSALQRDRNELLIAVPAAMVMKERQEIRPTFVLVRGEYDKPGDRVERGVPSFLPPLSVADPVAEGAPTRMDLARWLVDRQHPLTWRVEVNRLWQQFFGVGLVKTAEDFGTHGEWPRSLALLDHLSRSFAQSGGDVKALVREIVLSATYQQSSAVGPDAFRADPENRALARGSRFRMDAEMVRDQVLATSGLLNKALFGKSVKPPQPAGVWEAVTLPSSYPREYHADTGDKIYRRSIYTFWKRGMPPPQMSMLNAPTRESCTARRERTNTPLQALLLMNEREYLKAARNLALSTFARGPLDDSARLALVYETITGRLLDDTEREAFLDALRDLEEMYRRDEELASALCEGVALEDSLTPSKVAAWTLLASAIYNLDITKTRE